MNNPQFSKRAPDFQQPASQRANGLTGQQVTHFAHKKRHFSVDHPQRISDNQQSLSQINIDISGGYTEFADSARNTPIHCTLFASHQ
jgi:hypothetical protein